MVIITGDMNSKVESDNEDIEQVMRKQGMRARKDNGESMRVLSDEWLCDNWDIVSPQRHL